MTPESIAALDDLRKGGHFDLAMVNALALVIYPGRGGRIRSAGVWILRSPTVAVPATSRTSLRYSFGNLHHGTGPGIRPVDTGRVKSDEPYLLLP